MATRKQSGIAAAILSSLLLSSCATYMPDATGDMQQTTSVQPVQDAKVLEVFNQLEVPESWVENKDSKEAVFPQENRLDDSFGIVRGWNIEHATTTPTVEKLEEIIQDNQGIFDEIEVKYHKEDLGYKNHSVGARIGIDGKDYALAFYTWYKPDGIVAHALLMDYQEAEDSGLFDNHDKIWQ